MVPTITRAGTAAGRRRHEALSTAAMFYPAFALVAAVSFFPLFYALRQSVHRADYLDLGRFVGFGNFVTLFSTGGGLHFVAVSMMFVAGTLMVALPAGVGLALLLSRPLRLRGLFRTVLMLPWVVSELVTGYLWMWFYDGRLGPLTGLLGWLGVPSPLTDTYAALPALILANSWHAYPLVMIFTLAALQTVPADIQDAARLDTCTEWQRFRFVTLPFIRGAVLVAAVLTTLRSFNNVTLVLAMTGGGPVGATDVLGIRVFNEAFQFYRMDVASTIAVVIFALNIVASVAFMRVLRAQET
jgi:multiple sugar transport system permease protein